MTVELTPARLTADLDALSEQDARFAAARAAAGDPELRRWPLGFATLMDIIIGQQVSNAAAAAIRAKLTAALGEITPARVLAASVEDLRAGGLSRPKAGYALDLAARVQDGRLDLDGLAAMDDAAATAALTAVKGFGRWSAEIYLLFALGRADVWPAADLALAVALQKLLALPDRPKEKDSRALTAAWAPRRGAAAHFLWRYYRFDG